jgi:GT2 family glycosyltransferase
MTVSALVVTWNNARSIERCLAAVEADEVLVWDNASVDGTAEVATVRSPENVGFASGMNELARRATGEYLLLLNPDAYLEPGAVSRLVAAADARTIVGARLAGPDGDIAFPLRTNLATAVRPSRERQAAGAGSTA